MNEINRNAIYQVSGNDLIEWGASIAKESKEEAIQQVAKYISKEKENSEILTLEEAAKYLKVHKNTIRNLISRGQLRYYKLDNIKRIRKGDIDSLLEAYQLQ